MKYRIYIDENGNSDLGSSDNPNHRFLSLSGIIVELDHVEKVIYPELESLKIRYFHSHPDDPLVFHRAEMVNAKPPFDALKDAFVQQRFDAELLERLTTWDYKIISVCIDKKKHKETYSTWRFDPYHYCLAILMERFVFFLDHVDSRGDAMAESRGGKEDIRLKASYENLFERGSDFVGPDRFQSRLTSRQLKVKPKTNNVAGLQLADLLSHPSRCEILDERGLLGRPLGPFATKVIALLQDKYYRHGGKIHGKKFI